MKRYTISLAAAMMIAGSAVFAQTAMTADGAIAKVKEAYGTNFSRIEVRTGLTQIKVEAFNGTQKVEVILDKATGDILKRETETAGIFENTKPGVFLSERSRDFLRNGSDDDSNDDDDDLDDSDDDRDDDDNSSGSDDSDDDSNDDKGGDRNRSNDRDDDRDDDSNDDNGNDDSSDD